MIARIKSLVRDILLGLRSYYQRRLRKMDIHPTVRMSLSAKLDTSFPAGIHIDRGSYIAFDARIMTHDFTRGLYLHTRIGQNCFIGGRSIILPGISIGDGSIVGAGSVVTKDVPPGCAVAGNPARIVKEGIKVGHFGRLKEANANESRIRASDPDAKKLSDRNFRPKQNEPTAPSQ